MPDPRPVDHEVARAGLEAAAAVVERMLELGRAGASGIELPIPRNQEAPAPPATPDDGRAGGGPDAADLTKVSRRLRADAERLVELYASWTRALVDGAANLAEQAMERGPRASGPFEAALRLGPAARGTTTAAEAWLHVLDGPPGPPARVHASDLVAHHGDRIQGELVSTAPTVLDTAASRTSAAVAVSVAVPDRIRPGTYYGYLLADGLPEVVLPVVLEVVS
ncbi:MAG: hypothetical protein ABWZ52_03640 [Acidimicrobiales bacterium]